MTLTYSFKPNWAICGLVGYKPLLDDAEDGPVAKIGDGDLYVASLVFT